VVWFGEKGRKLARLSMTTFTYRSSSYYFMADTMLLAGSLVAFLLMPQADAFLFGLWDTTTQPPLQRTVSP
jgi:hypothetical protein